MGFVLRVHEPCTASTWLLYCEYMGFVLCQMSAYESDKWLCMGGKVKE